MITEQLTSRQDLLELLETEPVFDYLIQHGVLDKQKLDGICSEDTKSERTKALLQHLEDNSNTAVIGLFINALRQSGQLHLASLLDIDQKIKLSYGSGYLGKQRHKGQVAIEIVLEAVKVPKDVEPEKVEEVDTEPQSLQRDFSHYRLHKSYEDMTLLDGEDGTKPYRWRIGEYPYDFDDIDEEENVKGSFWTMCLPIFCRGKSTHKNSKPSKHNTKKTKKKSNKKSSADVEQLESHYEKCKDKRGKISPVMERTKKFPIQSSHSQISSNTFISNSNAKWPNDSGEVTVIQAEPLQHTDSNQNTPTHLTEVHKVKYKNNLNKLKTKQNGSVTKCVNNTKIPPIIIITKPDEEKTDNDSLRSCDDQHLTNNAETADVWRSDGLVYDGHVEKLFSSLDIDVHDRIVKYFEQDRRTLVLQILCEQSLNICNICMSQDQVEKLEEDYNSGKLLKDLEQILLTEEYIQKMHFLDMKIEAVIDKNEFQLAIQDMA